MVLNLQNHILFLTKLTYTNVNNFLFNTLRNSCAIFLNEWKHWGTWKEMLSSSYISHVFFVWVLPHRPFLCYVVYQLFGFIRALLNQNNGELPLFVLIAFLSDLSSVLLWCCENFLSLIPILLSALIKAVFIFSSFICLKKINKH